MDHMHMKPTSGTAATARDSAHQVSSTITLRGENSKAKYLEGLEENLKQD